MVPPSAAPKRLYLAHHQPQYDRDGFIHRWREHAALGMSQARWRNVIYYAHCDQIAGLSSDTPTIDCDGIALVTYRSETARKAHQRDTQAGTLMKEDERHTFALPVAQTSFTARELARLTQQVGPLALFVFWKLTDQEDNTSWHAHGQNCVSAFASSPLIHGYIQDALTPHDENKNFIYQGVEQISADNVDTLSNIAQTWVQHASLSGTAHFVLTRPVVLHDVI